MSKRIMIVGGTGFFGKSLFRYLADLSKDVGDIESVYVVSRNPDVAKDFFDGKVNGLKYELLSGDVEVV